MLLDYLPLLQRPAQPDPEGVRVTLDSARKRWRTIGRYPGAVAPNPTHKNDLESSWFARWLDVEL